jgi:hypothetical protein
MVDTQRYRLSPAGRVDYSEDQTQVTDVEGYVWNFAPNEAKVLPSPDYQPSLAVGDIKIDDAEQPSRV